MWSLDSTSSEILAKFIGGLLNGPISIHARYPVSSQNAIRHLYMNYQTSKVDKNAAKMAIPHLVPTLTVLPAPRFSKPSSRSLSLLYGQGVDTVVVGYVFVVVTGTTLVTVVVLVSG